MRIVVLFYFMLNICGILSAGIYNELHKYGMEDCALLELQHERLNSLIVSDPAFIFSESLAYLDRSGGSQSYLRTLARVSAIKASIIIGKHDLVSSLVEEITDFREMESDPIMYTDFFTIRSDIHLREGNFAQAFSDLKKAESVGLRFYPEGMFSIYTRLADICSYLKLIKDSKYYYNQGVIYLDYDSQREVFLLHRCLARHNRGLEDTELAKRYYNRCIGDLHQKKNSTQLGLLHREFGEMFLDLKSYNMARDHLDSSQKYMNLDSNLIENSILWLDQAELNIGYGKNEVARAYLDSVSIAVQANYMFFLKTRYYQLELDYYSSTHSVIEMERYSVLLRLWDKECLTKGQSGLVWEMNNMFEELNDLSVTNELYSQQLTSNLPSQQDLVKINETNHRLGLNRERLIIFLVITIVLLLIGVIYMSLKSKSKGKMGTLTNDYENKLIELNRTLFNTQELLAFKQKKILSLDRALTKRNEAFITLLHKSEEEIEDESESKEVMIDWHTKLKDSLSRDDLWNNYILYFETKYPKFLLGIKIVYPSLTPKELQHTAYVLMGMTAKDVSALIDISVKGVGMARYRIKKKMNLSSGVTLFEHLKILNDRFEAESNRRSNVIKLN